MMSCVKPGQGKGNDRAANMGKGAQIFKSENDVRLPNEVVGGGGFREGSGIGAAIAEPILEAVVFGGLDFFSYGLQFCKIVAFRAEGQEIDDAEAVEKTDASGCEILRAARGENDGKLQHERRAVPDGGFRPTPLIKDGDSSALGKASAHGDDNTGVGKTSADFAKLQKMAVMERIVFRNDADGCHVICSFLLIIVFSVAKNGAFEKQRGTYSAGVIGFF